ncbi:MAG: adenosine kinase [Bacteroidota bacterium]|nr:adenosine kinase [Bacteroidota bacterium]
MKIIGIGNALVDIMTRLDKDEFLSNNNLPKGSMQLVDAEKSLELLKSADRFEKQQVSGGSAANTIRSLARLGVDVSFLGKVGQDDLGVFYEKEMQDYGVKTLMSKSDIPTGTALALVSPDGERTFATHLGAAVMLMPNDISEKAMNNNDIIYLEGYLVMNHALLERAAELKNQHNMKIAIDLASFNVVEAEHEFLTDFVKNHVDIVFANEEEAAAFFPGKSPEEAVVAFSEMVEIAIVKVGAEGAYIRQGDTQVKVPGRSANSIDTTGAGDNFAAGFFYGLSNNLGLEKSGHIANLMGCNVIEVIGTSMDENRWKNIFSVIDEIK